MSKKDWNNEFSSWSDEDLIRIFHEHPDLADRFRKIFAEPVKHKRRYAQGTALGEFGIIPMCDQVDTEPAKVSSDDTQSLSDEYKAILKECRDKAMDWTVCGRIPECGMFSQIAQDLDYLCEQLGIDND